MNAHSATDIIAARPFAFSPSLARMVEAKAAELMCGREAPKPAAPPVPTGGITPQKQAFLEYMERQPEGKPHAEIAAELGIGVSTVRNRIHDLRQSGRLSKPAAVPVCDQISAQVKRMRAGGYKIREIGQRLNVSHTTVARAMKVKA